MELDPKSMGYNSTIDMAANLPDLFNGHRPNAYSDHILHPAKQPENISNLNSNTIFSSNDFNVQGLRLFLLFYVILFHIYSI
jgi:hypothetical protein